MLVDLRHDKTEHDCQPQRNQGGDESDCRTAEPRQEVLGQLGGGTFYGTPTFYVYSPTGELMARQIGPISIEAIEEYIRSVSQAQQEKKDANG